MATPPPGTELPFWDQTCLREKVAHGHVRPIALQHGMPPLRVVREVVHEDPEGEHSSTPIQVVELSGHARRGPPWPRPLDGSVEWARAASSKTLVRQPYSNHGWSSVGRPRGRVTSLWDDGRPKKDRVFSAKRQSSAQWSIRRPRRPHPSAASGSSTLHRSGIAFAPDGPGPTRRPTRYSSTREAHSKPVVWHGAQTGQRISPALRPQDTRSPIASS